MQFIGEHLTDLPDESIKYFLLLQGNKCPTSFVNFKGGLTLSRKQRKCLKNDNFDVHNKLHIEMDLAE